MTAPEGTNRDADGRPVLRGASMLPPMQNPKRPQNTERPKRNRKGNADTGNRFAVLNAFVDSTLATLSRSELAVWLVLYRDTRDGTVRTAQTDIARRAGVSVRSVKTAIAKLTAAGLLTVVYRGGLNRGPSRYRVHSLVK
jgi:hypothetical protein